jgi:hypothetical protein
MSRTLTVSETNVPATFRLARLASGTERTAGFLADVIGEQVTDGAPAPNPRRRPCYANSRLLQLRPRRWPLQLWRRLPPPRGVVGTAGITALAGVLQAFMLAVPPIMVTAVVMCGDWSRHRGAPAGAWSIAATEHHRATPRGKPRPAPGLFTCAQAERRVAIHAIFPANRAQSAVGRKQFPSRGLDPVPTNLAESRRNS